VDIAAIAGRRAVGRVPPDLGSQLRVCDTHTAGARPYDVVDCGQYAMEVEAGGKRLFYSGDLRAHGRKGSLFEALITNPPLNIDTVLLEGSSLGRLADDQSFPSEAALEEVFVDRFKDTAGMALVACSAQNIDRVVTVYRAAKRTGRTLIVDAYAAEVLKATGQESIPKPAPGWSNLAVYMVPKRSAHGGFRSKASYSQWLHEFLPTRAIYRARKFESAPGAYPFGAREIRSA
jgi:hypothetical protein